MVSIRPATVQDVPTLLQLIREFARYDRMDYETAVTEEDLTRDGFGPAPKFRATIAESVGEIAGYALFFEFYSSFQGRAGLFLDDIFVREQFRKHGVGKALLGYVARLAIEEHYFCIRCETLNWNNVALDFYRELGALFLDEWKSVCLVGESLEAVANEQASH
jgi:GNAT superfamily N-acetyltransferase